MKSTVTLTYYKVYDKFLYRHRLERENEDEQIDPQTIASEVQEQIEQIMDQERVSGKITITIEVGN